MTISKFFSLDDFRLGFYIHKLNRLPPPDQCAKLVKDMGGSIVFIKSVNGSYLYNEGYKEQYIQAFRANGIEIGLWAFIFTDEIVSINLQVDLAIGEIEKYQPVAFLIDAEEVGSYEAFWKTSIYRSYSAANYMRGLEKHLSYLPEMLGLSTYRYPILHREIPWNEFRDTSRIYTYDAPQVYWAGSHNPDAQLNRSYQEYTQIYFTNLKPYYPFGAAYEEHGWKALPDDLYRFIKAAKYLSLVGCGFWELYYVLQNPEWMEAIRLAMEYTPEESVNLEEWAVLADAFLREQGFIAPPLVIEQPTPAGYWVKTPISDRLSVRAKPAGAYLDYLPAGSVVYALYPDVVATYNGISYTWAEIKEPKAGWIAVSICTKL